MFAAELHDASVDLHHVELGDTGMAQAFPCGAAITAADHQHPFDRLRPAEGRVHQGLVVVTFLMLGGHPAAVEQQASAVTLTADHTDALKRAALLHQRLAGQAVTHAAVLFVDPVAHRDGEQF